VKHQIAIDLAKTLQVPPVSTKVQILRDNRTSDGCSCRVGTYATLSAWTNGRLGLPGFPIFIFEDGETAIGRIFWWRIAGSKTPLEDAIKEANLGQYRMRSTR
jgi:hypothetical protein